MNKIFMVKQEKSRINIWFSTTDFVSINDVVKFKHNDIPRYFKIEELRATSDDFIATAYQYGYYNKISSSNTDLRLLIDLEVTKETDEDILKKLEESSGYC